MEFGASFGNFRRSEVGFDEVKLMIRCCRSGEMAPEHRSMDAERTLKSRRKMFVV